jgi:hypothetical protein
MASQDPSTVNTRAIKVALSLTIVEERGVTTYMLFVNCADGSDVADAVNTLLDSPGTSVFCTRGNEGMPWYSACGVLLRSVPQASSFSAGIRHDGGRPQSFHCGIMDSEAGGFSRTKADLPVVRVVHCV